MHVGALVAAGAAMAEPASISEARENFMLKIVMMLFEEESE